MVFFNYSTMQMAAKVVYYGPGLCGKTTNLHYIYSQRLNLGQVRHDVNALWNFAPHDDALITWLGRVPSWRSV